MSTNSPSPDPHGVLSAAATAAALPWDALARAIESLAVDPGVAVPPRIVQPLAGGGSFFVMPASDGEVAIAKLITFVPSNSTRGLPGIQGDVVAFDVATGARRCILDGPTVTARRTAAVSLVAARRLARSVAGPMLIVGAGVQGRAHLEAFHAGGLPITEVRVSSRSAASADALAERARSLGLPASRVVDADAALADCAWIVTATPAQRVAVRAMPREDAFVAAVGAFTPTMVEWSPDVCRRIARDGTVVVDTRDADHEAGDLLQAGIDVGGLRTLADVVRGPAGAPARGPVFFKSCGWAGWDLAAARCVLADLPRAGADPARD